MGVGGGTRCIGIDLDEGAGALAGGVGNTCQGSLDQLAAGSSPGSEILGEAHYGRLMLDGRGHVILVERKNSDPLGSVSSNGPARVQ
jgi:hypothetical protein